MINSDKSGTAIDTKVNEQREFVGRGVDLNLSVRPPQAALKLERIPPMRSGSKKQDFQRLKDTTGPHFP